MVSEKDLIDLIAKDYPSVEFHKACELMIKKLKNDPQKKMLINIIQLLYSEGSLNFGTYLSQHKSKIIDLLYEGFLDKFKILELIKYLKEIERYGILFPFLEEAKGLEGFILNDFFKILIDDKNIKEVLNKYFNRKIDKELQFNFKINNAEEFLELIDKSMCFKNNNYDYNILYNYIKNQEVKAKKKKKKKDKKKNANKKSEKINISESEDIANTPNVENISEDKNTEKTDKDNNINEKQSETSENKSMDISLNKNEKEAKKVDIINDKESCEKSSNVFIEYFKERKQYYSKKGIETPFLDELINGNAKVDKNLFLLKIPKNNNFFEPYYPNLENEIDIFNDSKKFEEYVLKGKKFGYLCYKVQGKFSYFYKEGLYAILKNEILYSEITNKNKFVKDDYFFSDEKVVDNSYKARGLSLEYYLNGFFMEHFSQEELPRVIYNFDPDSINKEEEEKEGKEEKNKALEESEIKKRNIAIEEIDGIFYVEKYNEININKLPFIIDDVIDIQGSSFEFNFENNDSFFNFDAGTLVLLEVKNRFPDDLEKEIYISLNKVMSFYQLYEERYKNIAKLRIMFFYDAIPKKNYDKKLIQILNRFFADKDEIRNKIQFQFIIINSSYLAFNFKYLKDKIDKLEAEFKEKYTLLEESIKNLTTLVNSHQIKIDGFSQIKEENEKLKVENGLLKNQLEVIEGKEKNSFDMINEKTK